MCLQCLADEGTERGYCAECGCLIALFDGEPMCTADECWCAKRPDVGDWHALGEAASPPHSAPVWPAVLDLFED